MNSCLRQTILATALASLAIAENQATAIGGDVTSGSGSYEKLVPPPAAVGNDNQNTLQLYVFDEDQNINLAAPLAVNLIASGGSGSISAGTTVASHYVFFDPFNSASQEGYVDFDSDILGVITSTALLAASDFLANTGVTYNNPGLRGLEAGDSAFIDPLDSKRLRVDWTASSPGDYVRVITARSPGAAPDGGSTLVILGLGAGLLAGAARQLR